MVRPSVVWNYFDKTTKNKGLCRLCGIFVPTTLNNTSSLRSHLKHKHPNEYDELTSIEAANKISNENNAKVTNVTCKVPRKYTTQDVVVKKLTGESTSSGSCYEELAAEVFRDIKYDDDVPDHAQETEAEDVWHYFEKIPSNRARCILCKETFNRNLSFLTKHMTDKHRKVALDLPSDSDDDRNCYTEVVYLEEEQPASVETKPKLTKKTPEAKRLKLSPKYEYLNQLKKSERPSKNKEVDDEIENFGRYVIGLLKKMPKDISTQLQMDIISMIMTAKLKLETSTTESVNVSMSNVHDGVVLTPSNVIVTTPSNVIHTTQNNESLPTLVIGVENES